MEAANQALVSGDFQRALSEAEQGLALAPKSPTFLNHIASALHQLSRHDEADEINRRLAAEHPEYLFARVAMADMAIRENRLDEAHTWIDPLLTRQRFHISEFRAVALIYISYWRAKDELTSASHWIQMLDQVDPDSVTDEMRLMVSLSAVIDKLKRLPKRRK